MPEFYYTRTSTFTRISTRTGGTTADFSGTPRVVDYTRTRAGTASTRLISYANFEDGNESTAFYSRSFVGDFIGNFTGNYVRSFSRSRTVESIGYYSRNYIGYYTRAYQGFYTVSSAGGYSRLFAGNYARSFLGVYSRGYSGLYTRSSTNTFSGTFTRTSVGDYTRTTTRVSTISGGTGAPPTYTGAPASDAEYGLVVYGPDGVTEIINPTTRVLNLVFYGSVSVGPYSTTNITIEDVGDPTKVIVAFGFRYTSISYSVSGNTLTVINDRSTASAPVIIAARIA